MFFITLFITSILAGDDDLIFRDSFEPIDLGVISYVAEADTVFDQLEAVLEVRATATDQFGRQTTATITVYVDQTVPFVTVNNTFERITSANYTEITGGLIKDTHRFRIEI